MGIPTDLRCDGAKEHQQPGTVFAKTVKKCNIHGTQTEPSQPLAESGRVPGQRAQEQMKEDPEVDQLLPQALEPWAEVGS